MVTIHNHKGRHYAYAEDLPLDWSSFRFADYYTDETTILQPQLESLGFTVHSWHRGEGDSFGTLTRYAITTYGDDQVRFVYG